MLVVANVARAAALASPLSDPGIWYSTLVRLDPLAVGALIAFYLHGRAHRMDAAARVLLLVLAALLLLFIGRYADHVGSLALFYYPLEAVVCELTLCAILRPMHSWTPGPLGRTFTYLGRISYGLYVFHMLFLALIDRAPMDSVACRIVVFLLTVLTASASYFLLEMPFCG